MARPGSDRRGAPTAAWIGRPGLAVAGILALLAAAMPAQAAEGGIALVPGALPNYVGFGLGIANDYMGSDDVAPGGLPLARLSRENRYITLEGNYLAANLVNHPVLRFGPAGLYRFGRDDVDDDVVDRLPSINDTIELGGFAGVEFVGKDDPRKRIYVSFDFLHDVAGSHNGYVLSASARLWYPLARATEIGVAVASSYGSENYMSSFFSIGPQAAARSGLAAYDAGEGLRDARLTVMVVQSLSKSWHVGAGLLYSRLLSEAADSPIVDDRGSANQILVGAGFVYSW